MIHKLQLSDLESNASTRITLEVFRLKKEEEGNRLLRMNSFDDYSSRAESMETSSRLDIIACSFVVILHRKYSQRYNQISEQMSLSQKYLLTLFLESYYHLVL